jgi:hypothetical protein
MLRGSFKQHAYGSESFLALLIDRCDRKAVFFDAKECVKPYG